MGLRYLGQSFSAPVIAYDSGSDTFGDVPYSFEGDAGAGMALLGSDTGTEGLGLFWGGELRFLIDDTQVRIPTPGKFSAFFFTAGGGNVAAPAFSFVSDPDTGMYPSGANELGFAAGGSHVMGINPSEVLLNVPTRIASGSVLAPGLTFHDDHTTGIYRAAGGMFFASSSLPVIALSSAAVFTVYRPSTVLDTVTINRAASYSSGNEVIRLMADSDSAYSFYADNAGSGSDNSRLWLDGPQGGQVVIGPRSGSVRLNQVRIRSGSLVLDTAPYSGTSGYPMAYIRDQGNWTPSVQGSSSVPSVTYTLQDGRYMRIGACVWFTGRITVNTRSGGGGQLQIGGLPYSVWNLQAYRPTMTIALSGVSYAAGGVPWMVADAGATRFGVNTQHNNGSFQTVNVTNVANGAALWFSGFYWTADS